MFRNVRFAALFYPGDRLTGRREMEAIRGSCTL